MCLRVKKVLVALSVLALAAALSAGAASRHDYALVARDILPPGNFGGANFTPHSTDQAVLYDALTPLFDKVTAKDITKDFKAEPLWTGNDKAVRTELPGRGVKIKRDSFDVPHVFGKTETDVFYGVGWAVAEDRGLLMELARYPGRLACLDAPGFNGAWNATGDYSQMRYAFSAQPNFPATSKQPVPAHPYSQYKCRTTPGSSVGAANRAAADNRSAGYTGIGNNCLDATYRVLAAYGVPDLPWTQTNPYPNNWFNALGGDWQAGSLGETWYNVKAQMALDLDHANSANGTATHQWPGNGSEAQWWIRTLVPGGYELFSRATGKCVGVAGGSTAQGAYVVEWDCNGSTDQRWSWRSTGATVGGWPVYHLVNVKSGRCLGISGGSTAQGALAVQWTCNGNPDQSWY